MGLIVKILAAAIGILLPPGPDATPQQVLRWRRTIAPGVMIMACALTTQIALAWGFLPVFTGFAWASDVTTLEAQQRGIRADALRAQIVVAVKDQCAARKQSNPSAENYATARKYQLMDELRHVGEGHETIDVPQCWEVP